MPSAHSYVILAAAATTASAFFNPSVSNGARVATSLFHNAPKHDVNGQKTIEDLAPDQQERVKAFLEHQQSVPKIGFAADVRSLIQYNHGFAVMSTNSKS